MEECGVFVVGKGRGEVCFIVELRFVCLEEVYVYMDSWDEGVVYVSD